MKAISRPFLLACVITALFFSAIAPTLTWQEFSSSMESLNIATVQEIYRTGNWLVPTLQGETRFGKPPLVAWMTASMVTHETRRDISSYDAGTREIGFEKLAWETRLTGLLAACATIIVTFLIARLLAGDEVGVVSTIVLATSLLMLRFARYASIDNHLALWVSVSNLLLLMAVMKRQWKWLYPASLALGVAMMTKGPVALLQSVLPIGIYLAWGIFKKRISAKGIFVPLIVGIAIFAVVGLSWYALMPFLVPDIWHKWGLEVTGYAAIEVRGSPWFTYFCLIPYMAPWIGFFIAGLVVAFRRRTESDVLLLLLLLVPILVMSFFHDKYERYLLPMLPSAAILTAIAVVEHLRIAKWTGLDKLINASQWILLAMIGIGFPIAASGPVRGLVRLDDNQPWFGHAVVAEWSVFSAAIILAGILLQRRNRAAILVTTFAVMLAVQSLFMAGYSRSAQGRAEYRPLAERIWALVPDAEVYNSHPRGKRPPPDVGVYLDRTVPWIADPSQLQPGDKPKVLLLQQDKGTPAPEPPSGWNFLFSRQHNEDVWWAFVLPAKS